MVTIDSCCARVAQSARVKALDEARAAIKAKYIDVGFANKDWRNGMRCALSIIDALKEKG